MWTQIVVTLILLIVGTYVVQFFLPRAGRASANTTARWDIAPALGFFGALLLALALVEALRQTIVAVWTGGLGLGLLLGIATWVGLRQYSAPVSLPGSALVATFRILRAYGTLLFFAAAGVYLVVRYAGSVIDVFLASALGLVIVIVALRIFVGAKQMQRK